MRSILFWDFLHENVPGHLDFCVVLNYIESKMFREQNGRKHEQDTFGKRPFGKQNFHGQETASTPESNADAFFRRIRKLQKTSASDPGNSFFPQRDRGPHSPRRFF